MFRPAPHPLSHPGCACAPPVLRPPAGPQRRIGTRWQKNGHSGANDDADQGGTGQIFQVLCENVGRVEIRGQQDIDIAGNRAVDVLDACGFGGDGIVEGQRTIDDGMLDLSSLGHLA